LSFSLSGANATNSKASIFGSSKIKLLSGKKLSQKESFDKISTSYYK